MKPWVITCFDNQILGVGFLKEEIVVICQVSRLIMDCFIYIE